MPLGFERINERTQRPNPLINFIKPLPSAQASTAEQILSRIAAICYPFMKQHQIAVQSLEEFPPNNEFVGRNFNAGEVIQLVLKNKRGEWLPEKWVQMVMVHELAHCKEMNHGTRFWKWRDGFAGDLRALWGRGYTGEGMWGRGRRVLDGGLVGYGQVDRGLVPENLCGGTFARKRRKRGRAAGKDQLSYAERKQRRILRKFGAGGQPVGADDDTKVKLEGGVVKKGKPRVAGSARGRELRAAAALARFEQVKKEEPEVKEEQESDSDDDYEEPDDSEAAVDIDGQRMVDENGHGLVKICEGEDGTDDNARREMDEFREIGEHVDVKSTNSPSLKSTEPLDSSSTKPKSLVKTTKPVDGKSKSKNISQPIRPPPAPSNSINTPSGNVIHLSEIHKRRADSGSIAPTPPVSNPPVSFNCKVCSLCNEPGSLTCAACSNVLNPHLVANHWMCRSAACRESGYINAGDAGRCGVCGGGKAV